MKPANFAPVYALLYPVIADICREHGYALAVHGTLQRDFDVIAVPWKEDACSAEDLVQALHNYTKIYHGAVPVGPTVKSHGRRAWAILLGCGAYIDISITPRAYDSLKLKKKDQGDEYKLKNDWEY